MACKCFFSHVGTLVLKYAKVYVISVKVKLCSQIADALYVYIVLSLKIYSLTFQLIFSCKTIYYSYANVQKTNAKYIVTRRWWNNLVRGSIGIKAAYTG